MQSECSSPCVLCHDRQSVQLALCGDRVIRHAPLYAFCVHAMVGLRLVAVLAGHLFLVISKSRFSILDQNTFCELIEEVLICQHFVWVLSTVA